MTAIACFRIANVAMLFGDLLLSAKTPPAKELELPAMGPLVPDGIKREYYPVGFAQKVCPINDNLIIAWAGPHFVASSVIKGMRETFAASPVTRSSLDRLFREYGVHDRGDSQFIGIYNEGGRHTSFGINT